MKLEQEFGRSYSVLDLLRLPPGHLAGLVEQREERIRQRARLATRRELAAQECCAHDTALDDHHGRAEAVPSTEPGTYADPGYHGSKRMPLATMAQCQAAVAWLSVPGNAAKYTAAQLASMTARIKAAVKGLTPARSSLCVTPEQRAMERRRRCP